MSSKTDDSKDATTAMRMAGNDATPAIELTHLRKVFGKFVAIDDLNLTVNPCEIFGLLGPNGSGKTTTVNMISGLSKPTSGQINVLGHDLRSQLRQVRRLLGAVPQETALYEELTAWANLDFHAELFGIPRAEKNHRISQILELVQLADRKDSRVGTFSGGMKRRLAIGRALLHDPQLIYLDEPTLGVDVQSRRAIWDYIIELRRQCKTVLITTNYLEEAQVLCDRIAIIDHGKLVALNTPDELKRKYGGSVVEIEMAQATDHLSELRQLPGIQEVMSSGAQLTITTLAGSNAVPLIVNLLAQQGNIVNITVREPNLEEVFLHLTGNKLRD